MSSDLFQALVVVQGVVADDAPVSPELPAWAPDYLDALLLVRGNKGRAADLAGISRMKAFRAEVDSPDFERAVTDARRVAEIGTLSELEAISLDNAIDNKQAVAERMFQLKAHDPQRYREKTVGTGRTSVRLVYGFKVGGKVEAAVSIETGG